MEQPLARKTNQLAEGKKSNNKPTTIEAYTAAIGAGRDGRADEDVAILVGCLQGMSIAEKELVWAQLAGCYNRKAHEEDDVPYQQSEDRRTSAVRHERSHSERAAPLGTTRQHRTVTRDAATRYHSRR